MHFLMFYGLLSPVGPAMEMTRLGTESDIIILHNTTVDEHNINLILISRQSKISLSLFYLHIFIL